MSAARPHWRSIAVSSAPRTRASWSMRSRAGQVPPEQCARDTVTLTAEADAELTISEPLLDHPARLVLVSREPQSAELWH
jgi:hypothetical protein